MPVGKLHELQTKSDENEKGEKGGEAEKGENDDNGDDDVHHTYTTTPEHAAWGEENSGHQFNACVDEAATHEDTTPRHELTTTPPIRTMYDEKSGGDGSGGSGCQRRGRGEGHRQSDEANDEHQRC
ncbi:hypothetical protein PAXINDRAFT_14751 [Paxillus involutus ATCC 200175]|uniref:Uncharacterized protein n=1 Tax=Paxillus involutus ATCC 200175 TaxID=664439 RepID=A0A0C9TXT7_PAXIN|nr:hypothetical protein PAXINDRAFT_14751 [Paxillus involutus ATCC 200175]